MLNDEKKRLAAGEKIRSDSQSGERTRGVLWSIGTRIWNCELKVWSLVLPNCSGYLFQRKCVNWRTNSYFIFKRHFQTQVTSPAEKTLMLNKPNSRLNINNNTLLLSLLLEQKFKNKSSSDPFSDFVNQKIELIQTLISFNNFFSLKTGKHHALYFTGPLTFVLLGGKRKLHHHHEEKQKSFLD